MEIRVLNFGALGLASRSTRWNRQSDGDLRGVGFIDPRGLAGGRFYRGFWVFTLTHKVFLVQMYYRSKSEKVVQMYYSTNVLVKN